MNRGAISVRRVSTAGTGDFPVAKNLDVQMLQFATHMRYIRSAKIKFMGTTISSKSGNIHFRVSSDAKEIIDKAVIASGQSLTEFATRSLLNSATELLEREYSTVLSNRDRDRLLKMLDAYTKPSKGLREAAKIHKKLIIE